MIRAIEPAAMIEQMSKNRGGKTGPDISNGPGKLVEALAIPQERPLLISGPVFPPRFLLICSIIAAGSIARIITP